MPQYGAVEALAAPDGTTSATKQRATIAAAATAALTALAVLVRDR
jgi:hypothetical protein